MTVPQHAPDGRPDPLPDPVRLDAPVSGGSPEPQMPGHLALAHRPTAIGDLPLEERPAAFADLDAAIVAELKSIEES